MSVVRAVNKQAMDNFWLLHCSHEGFETLEQIIC